MTDFKPVGVRAVVEDADKFVADMKRLEASVAQFSQGLKRISANLPSSFGNVAQNVKTLSTSLQGASGTIKTTGSTSQAASAQLGALSAAAIRSANSVKGILTPLKASTDRIKLLSAASTELSSAVGRSFSSFDRGAGAIGKVSSVINQAIQSNDRLKNSYIKSVSGLKQAQSAYANLAQAMAKLQQARNEEVVKAGLTLNKMKAIKDEMARNQAAIGQLNQRLNVLAGQYGQLDAVLQQTKAQFDANSNEVKNAQAALDAVEKEILQTTEASDQHVAANKALGQSYNQLENTIPEFRQNISRLDDAMGELQRRMQEAAIRARDFGGAITRLKAVAAVVVSIRALTVALKGLSAALLAPQNAAQFLGRTIQSLGNNIAEQGNRWFKFGNSVRFFGQSLSFIVTIPIIGFLSALTKEAIEFEDAWAEVVKTVDTSDFRVLVENASSINELTSLGKELQLALRELALTIPLPTAELTELAGVAGRLGITGTDNILTFVETAGRLGVTTNLTAEEAGKSLARLIAVSGGLSDAELAMIGFDEAQIEALSSSERFQIAMKSLGGVLVELGNRTRAEEAEILAFADRLRAVGAIAGFTSAEILGISAAFVAVGTSIERGGTAIQKIVLDLIEATSLGFTQIISDSEDAAQALEVFAKVAGTSAEEFVQLWGEDATEAFRRMVEGLGQLSQDEAVLFFKGINEESARLIETFLTIAEAEGELTDTLALVTDELIRQYDALGELDALTLESNRRFSTTSSAIQLLKNQFTELGITIGSFLLPFVNRVVEGFGKIIEVFIRLDPRIQAFILAMAVLAASAGPAIVAFGTLLSGVGLFLLVLGKVIALFGGVVAVLGLIVAPAAAAAAAIAGLGVAFLASIGKIQAFANITGESLKSSMFNFGKNIILSFARGMAAALVAVIQVLNTLGAIIAKWLAPGSPPRLLPDLDKWGTSAAEVWMEGWLDADFNRGFRGIQEEVDDYFDPDKGALPDLDQWGLASMEEWIRGWGLADFNIFEDIAGRVESFLRSFGEQLTQGNDKALIERILGSRQVIAQMTNMIRDLGTVTEDMFQRLFQSIGGVSRNMERYIRALINVASAQERVKRAQEEINKITEKYTSLLRPIERRLKEISDRRREVSDLMRLAELEEILADPRAPELVRELASLEIEEIQLNAETRELEDARDIELERAEAKKEAAEIALELAQEELEIATKLLDLQEKQNSLMDQLLKKLEDVGGGIGELGNKLKEATGDIVDDIAGLIDDVNLDDLGGDLDPETLFNLDPDVQSAADLILDSINEIVDELKDIFDPVTAAWSTLGDTWAPIFDRIFEKLGPNITGGLKGIFTEMLNILDDIGLIAFAGDLAISIDAPFIELLRTMPLASKTMDSARDSFIELWDALTPLGQEIGRFVEDVNLMIETFRNLEGVGRTDYFLNFFENLEFGSGVMQRVQEIITDVRNAFEQTSGPVAGLKGIFEDFGDALGRLGESLSFAYDILKDTFDGIVEGFSSVEASSGTIEFIKGTVLGFVAAFTNGMAFLRNFFLDVIGNIVVFLSNAISSIVTVVSGIINIVEGFLRLIAAPFLFIIGLFTGDFDAAVSNAREAISSLVGGISEVISGILQFLIGTAALILETIFELGANLYDSLINTFRSIGIDIGQEWDDLGARLREGASTFAENVIGKIIYLKDRVIEFFTNLGSELGRIVGEFWENVFQFFRDAYDYLVGNSIIPDMVEAIIQWFIDLKDRVIEIVTNFVDSVIEFFQNMYDTIVQGVTDFVEGVRSKWEDLKQVIIDGMEAALDYLRELPSTLFELGVNILQGLTDGILSVLSGPLEALEGVGTGLIDTVKGLFNISSPSQTFKQFGENMMQGWGLGIEFGITGVQLIMTKFAADFTKVVVELSGDVIEVIEDFAEMWVDIFEEMARASMEDILVPFFEELVKAVDEKLLGPIEDRIEDFITSLAGPGGYYPQISSESFRLMSGLQETFESALTAIKTAWDTVLDGMTNKLSGLGETWFSSGQAAVQGLINGLDSLKLDLEAKVAEIAAIVAGLNGLLDIASPSKLMFEIGYNSILGLVKGLEETSKKLLMPQMQNIANTINISPPAYSATPVQASPIMAPQVSGGNSVTQTINMGGQTIQNGVDLFQMQIAVEQALKRSI